MWFANINWLIQPKHSLLDRFKENIINCSIFQVEMRIATPWLYGEQALGFTEHLFMCYFTESTRSPGLESCPFYRLET